MRQLAELDEATRSAAFECYAVLQPHLEQGRALARLAQQAGIPLRIAQRWVPRYRRNGLTGLVRSTRADPGRGRVTHDELVQLIEGLALGRPALPVLVIWQEAPGTEKRRV